MARRFTEDAFVRWLKRQAKAYPNRVTFAKELGVSPGQLSDVLNGHRPASAKFLATLNAREVRLIEVA